MNAEWRSSLRWNLLLHLAIWLLSAGFGTLYLYSSSDAWYVMARERFLGTFILIQIELLPFYGIVAIAALLWSWFAEGIFGTCPRRPGWLLTLWFWATVLTLSLVANPASWSVPLNFIRARTGLDLSLVHSRVGVACAWVNAVLVTLIAAAGLVRQLYRRRGRGLYAAAAAATALLAIGLWLHHHTDEPLSVTSRSPRKSPNIILFGSDSLRADHLGCYGYSRDTSPTIDGLAREGVRCERVYAVTPSTQESLLALLSGEPPYRTGIHCIFPLREAVEHAGRFPQLAEVLHAAGYRTVAAGDWAASDFELVMKGFDVRDVEPAMRFTDYLDGAARRCHPLLLAFFTTPATDWIMPSMTTTLQSRRTAESVLRRAEAEITRSASTGQPLFLFLFLSTTHFPYSVPRGEPVLFGAPDYRGRHQRQVEFNLDELTHSDLAATLYPERERVNDLYDSCVRAFDGQVARVQRAISRSGLDRDTLFVVLSDHGEDHWDPGTTLNRTISAGNQSVRIPMILHWPSKLPARGLPEVLPETDFAATVAELAGVPWQGGGRSFAPEIEGSAPAEDREAYVEASVTWDGPILYPPSSEHLSYPSITDLVVPDLAWDARMVIPAAQLGGVMRAKDRALIGPRWKILYEPLRQGPRLRMFDLDRDPDCRSPILPDAELSRRLLELIHSDPLEFWAAWPGSDSSSVVESRP